jgi:hypothetical protein
MAIEAHLVQGWESHILMRSYSFTALQLSYSFKISHVPALYKMGKAKSAS